MKKIIILFLLCNIGFSQNCKNSIWYEINDSQNVQDSIINQYLGPFLSVNDIEEQLTFLDDCDSGMSYTMFVPHPSVESEDMAPLFQDPNIELIDRFLHFIYSGNIELNTPQELYTLEMLDGNNQQLYVPGSIEIINNATISNANIVDEICACNGTIYAIDSLFFAPVSNLIENGEGWMIYPNPSKNNLNVSKITEKGVLELLDMNGKILWRNEIKQNTKLNISKYKSGLYMLKFQSENYNFIETVLIN